MKKIIFTFLMFIMALFSEAQISFETSKDYGRLQDITYDPFIQNKLYAATLGNHIVVSNDNGLNWSLLYSYPDEVFISGLKLMPGNNALSFGTPDGIHIFNLTTNTITTTIPVPQSNVIDAGLSNLKSYSIYDSTGTTIIVDTGFPVGWAYQGKTFYTSNGGNTWNEIYYTVNNSNIHINSVAISPGNPSKLFLTRGHGDTTIDGGLLVSTNAGQTWTEMLAGTILDPIAFNPVNPNQMFIGTSVSYGVHPEQLYKSSDNGMTWIPVPISWTDEGMNTINKIVYNPLNSQQIVILEENEIVTSVDGGLSWNNNVYPSENLVYYYGLNASFNPFDSKQIAISNDFYPQFLDRDLSTLQQIRVPFCYVEKGSFTKYGANKHLFYEVQGGIIHKNLDSGIQLAYNIQQINSFNLRRNSIVPDSTVPGRVFTYSSMGFFGGALKMSTDYGVNFVDLFSTFADEIMALRVHPQNPNIIYVALRLGSSGNLTKIDFSDLNNIQVTDLPTPDLTAGDGVITGLIIHPTDPNMIYITKKNHFYKSSDDGLRWTDLSIGLESLESALEDYIWGLDINPLNSNQLTLCSTDGIFTTYDGGVNWSLLNSTANVKKVKHSPIANGVIIASTYSTETTEASILYSQNAGVTWTNITPATLRYVGSYEMDYDFDGSTINVYIATTDLGIVKHQINNITLGVNAPDKNIMGLKVYPNPAKDVLNISANYEVLSLSIYDMLGKCVLDKELNFTNGQLDISKLSEGCYSAKIVFENSAVQTVKIIKQ